MPSQRYNNLTEKIQRAQTLLDVKQIKDLSYNPMDGMTEGSFGFRLALRMIPGETQGFYCTMISRLNVDILQ